MSNIDKRALREELSNPANGSNAHLRKLALALLDELEAKDAELQEYRKAASHPVGLFAKRNGTWLELCQGDTFEHPDGVLLYSVTQPLNDAERAELQEYWKASQALKDVAAERQRQMSVEGWAPKHDDKHDNNELAFAASCYAFHSAAASWDFEDDGTPYDIHPAPKNWPWSPEWWKPKNPRRDLVKAGALILAEIERIDRAAAGKGEAS